jgi:iron(III) transport system permease protein
VERELEEEALLDAGPWRVLWHVTLARSRPALAAAALWIALQSAGEITVTDMMQVRTFAEEVYTQLVAGDGAAQSRALAGALPAVMLTALLVLVVLRRWESALLGGHSPGRPLCLIRLGAARWPTAAVLLAGFVALAMVPLSGLVWRAGRGGSPEAWSVLRLGEQLVRAVGDDTRLLVDSLALAASAGVVAAVLALLACWLALESRGFRMLILVVMALAWATPGPVLGLGLKDVIDGLMRLEETAGVPGVLRRLLYDGPSILPLVWVTVLRFFPCAVAILWPVVRRLPRELAESARLDGAGPLAELRWVWWPLTMPAVRLAGLAVGILSLGELAAGKLVATPGSGTFAHRIFTEMHYGVTNGVAALCLVVLIAVMMGSGIVAGWQRSHQGGRLF